MSESPAVVKGPGERAVMHASAEGPQGGDLCAMYCVDRRRARGARQVLGSCQLVTPATGDGPRGR